MTAGRTLASRGFVLPAIPPKVGHAKYDALEEWNAYALRKVIAEFLAPELAPISVITAGRMSAAQAIIDQDALAEGFGANMHHVMGTMRIRPIRNSQVNDWMGIPVEQIWPHHAPTTTQRKAGEIGAKSVEANTTLMAPLYSADSAACNPFVHTVSKRLIGAGAAFTALVLAGLIAARRHGGAR